MPSRSSPPFFISLSWHVTQYLSTTAETTGDNEEEGAAGCCCAAKESAAATKAGTHMRTRIPRRILSATHRPMGIGRFTVAHRLTAHENRDKRKGRRRQGRKKAQKAAAGSDNRR